MDDEKGAATRNAPTCSSNTTPEDWTKGKVVVGTDIMTSAVEQEVQTRLAEYHRRRHLRELDYLNLRPGHEFHYTPEDDLVAQVERGYP